MIVHRVFLSVGIALLGTLAWAVSPAQATTNVFSHTGNEQTFVVPSGVHLLHVLLIGGSGGQGGVAAEGGAAAEVMADLEVTPGETLYIEVGGTGKDNSEGGAGGFNGGANGGGGAGGGGGASDIRLVPGSTLLSLESRLVVAAGGGGGGGDGVTSPPGDGGDAGSAGESNEAGNEGGGAGTEFGGGGGGFGNGESGDSGELGSGGSGGNGEVGTNGGGGGGGGLNGGGGGGGGLNAGGGGGGGGSSLVPAEGELEIAAPSASPRIVITYAPPPDINITSPTGGATYTLGQAVTAIYSCTPQVGVGLVKCAGPVANGAPLDTSTLGQHAFTVNAEDTDGGTSSKTVGYTVLAAAPVGPPNTTIASHPRKVIKTAAKRVKVKFTFHSPTAGASFECKLDKRAYAACTSPKRYKVKVGKHKFSVRAVKGGVADPTPASFKFKVVKKAA
ncbi:MAG TPA: glycine-rich protein [Solirubrobacterales bacterium]|nr:glycine-rich protein [Solirubrobacterales bacterium]